MTGDPDQQTGDTVGPAPAQTTVSVEIRIAAETVIIRVVGDMDMTTTQRVRDAILAELDRRPQALVVDLNDVSFLGSDGLSALIDCYQHADSDTRFLVATASPLSLRPLQLTGLTALFAVYATADDATAET
jgi:anti-anti-sigma factor